MSSNIPVKTEASLPPKGPSLEISEAGSAKVPVIAVASAANTANATTIRKPVLPPHLSKKSKKKKNAPTVTMATAPSAAPGSAAAQGENTGRWTAEEHRLFLQGLEQHGKGWKKIASLIKSRTVVQIRTHAQKYFQKLAKARQNGEEGDVPMEGRTGPALTSGNISSVPNSNKRRRQTTGTKRKAISSVVASAQRQGNKMAAAQAAAGVPSPAPPLPVVAPALAPYVAPNGTVIAGVPSITTAHGTISGPALEDSLFRFLTPIPVAPEPSQVNDVARQVGANPITVPPSDNPSAAPAPSDAGDTSPTGVIDYSMYPSWTDAKDLPSWYAKGADVECLLDVAGSLDWIADSGDLHETYEPPKITGSKPSLPSLATGGEEDDTLAPKAPSIPSLNADGLEGMDTDCAVPSLPTLFDNTAPPSSKKSSMNMADAPEGSAMDHLNVFDTPMEEHAFVSALLENNGESSGSLPALS